MALKTLLVRADATIAMGTGHVMRCLALAQAWQDAGGRAIFAMADAPLPLRERLLAEKMDIAPIEASPGGGDDARETAELAGRCAASWVVVDGYHFGAAYQAGLKETGLSLLWIDDGGESECYAADIVLNQNVHAERSLYSKHASYTQILLGSRYVMLRREFARWREWKREIAPIARKVLVTMGGSDPDNITSLVVKALRLVKVQGLEAIVVAGSSNPYFESLQQMAAQSGGVVRLQRTTSNMPELMAWADLAVIAAGGTLWELLYMGCCVLSYARNPVQGRVISDLQRDGLVQNLGDPRNFDEAVLAAAMTKLASSTEDRSRACLLSRQTIDGKGAARICELLINREVRCP